MRCLVSTETLPSRTRGEIISSSLGGFAAIFLIAWGSGWVLAAQDVPFIVASMGAAAVLIFAAPKSTMSQPWPLIAGHLISAAIGVSCAKFIPDLALASAVAVGGAIFCMHLSRCLHPPGGAAALVAVIGGDSIQALGYGYLLAPVGMNVLIILLVAVLFNNALAGKPYPMRKSEARD